jgi:hypothetical protein
MMGVLFAPTKSRGATHRKPRSLPTHALLLPLTQKNQKTREIRIFWFFELGSIRSKNSLL